jgi:hypothetical protein
VELSTLKSTVNHIADRIGDLEGRRRRTSSALRSIGDVPFRIGSLTDDRIINQVPKAGPDCPVAGVDGGLLTRSFHGIDLVVVRAVGVTFDYKKGQVAGTKVFAQKIPFITEVNSGDDGELITVASLHRMKYEVAKAVEVVEESSPAYIMMDGPLYPHPSTRVAKGSHLRKLYKEVVSLYDRLAQACSDRNTKLVGIVEDSRSRYFASVISDKIVPSLPEKSRSQFAGVGGFRDTALLYDALQTGERTCTFKISQLQDLAYKDEVFGFYMRTAEYDRPLRVEIRSASPGKDVPPLASLVYGVAAFPSYGLPSVLVEADARAKLKLNYMEFIQKMLFAKSHSPLMMSLRRENRPV